MKKLSKTKADDFAGSKTTKGGSKVFGKMQTFLDENGYGVSSGCFITASVGLAVIGAPAISVGGMALYGGIALSEHLAKRRETKEQRAMKKLAKAKVKEFAKAKVTKGGSGIFSKIKGFIAKNDLAILSGSQFAMVAGLALVGAPAISVGGMALAGSIALASHMHKKRKERKDGPMARKAQLLAGRS